MRKAQAELAHVTRVTTLGELTASIAHEVNQPLAAVVANAEACLRWLDRETPNLDGARRSVEWLIDAGNRAGEVIRRVRALAKKTDLEKVPLDVNEVVREVFAPLRGELISHQVSVRTEFAPALPVILGDRVQLQQVITNLVMNDIEAMQSVTDPALTSFVGLARARARGPGRGPAATGSLANEIGRAKTAERGVNLLCHGRARASFSLTLRAGAMRLERIGRLGGAAAAGGGRDALSYGVSFATTRSHQLARGSGVLSLRHFGLVLFIPWRVGAEESGAAKKQGDC